MSEGRSRVLLVDDDPTILDVVSRYLELAGLEVETAADGLLAVEAVSQCSPDIVVLDVMLPGIDGLEVCKRIRSTTPVPVVMLTALGEENDRIVGLEVGADDYVAKPFSPRELILRVQSVLRRTQMPLHPRDDLGILADGDLRLDPCAHEVRIDGRLLRLTLREFDLLAFLMANPGQVFNRTELLHQVWNWSFGDQSTVTVHIRRLREKLGDDHADPRRIVTVWGSGYRYDPVETS